jgi:hypothetical protein
MTTPFPFSTTEEELLPQVRSAIVNRQYGAAGQTLKTLIEKNPRHEEAWWLLSQIVANPDRKRICLQNVLNINPQHVQAREQLAALQQSANIGNVTPPTPTVQPSRTVSLTDAEAEAIERQFDAHMELSPLRIQFAYERAEAFIQNGRRKAAYDLMKGAAKRYPKDERAWFILSRATDDITEKQEYLENVIRINPDNDDALRRLMAIQDALEHHHQSFIQPADEADMFSPVALDFMASSAGVISKQKKQSPSTSDISTKNSNLMPQWVSLRRTLTAIVVAAIGICIASLAAGFIIGFGVGSHILSVSIANSDAVQWLINLTPALGVIVLRWVPNIGKNRAAYAGALGMLVNIGVSKFVFKVDPVAHGLMTLETYTAQILLSIILSAGVGQLLGKANSSEIRISPAQIGFVPLCLSVAGLGLFCPLLQSSAAYPTKAQFLLLFLFSGISLALVIKFRAIGIELIPTQLGNFVSFVAADGLTLMIYSAALATSNNGLYLIIGCVLGAAFGLGWVIAGKSHLVLFLSICTGCAALATHFILLDQVEQGRLEWFFLQWSILHILGIALGVLLFTLRDTVVEHVANSGITNARQSQATRL